MTWENGRIPSQTPSHFSAMEWVQPCPQQGQKNSQFSEFLFHSKAQSFGAHKWLLSSLTSHPVILACSQLLFISYSPLELVCGAWMAKGHAAALDAWSSAPWTENTWAHRPGHQQVGEREMLPSGGHEENRRVHFARASHEQDQKSFFDSLGYIRFDVGLIRCFLKMNNQLPKLLHASGGHTSQPIPSLPCLTARHLWSSTFLQCHFDLCGTYVCLLLVTSEIQYQSW